MNGEVCRAPAQLISSEDQVTIDDRPLRCLEARHVLLHKPKGFLSTRGNVRLSKGGEAYEDERPNVYSLLEDPGTTHCKAVGRLDLDTSGALLFTTDGVLSACLCSPESRVEKVYEAKLRRPQPLSRQEKEQLAAGVELPEKSKKVVSGRAWDTHIDGVVRLAVTEGSYHQVNSRSPLDSHARSLTLWVARR